MGTTVQELDSVRAGFRGIPLERVDPSCNALRFYCLAWQPSLFDQGAVIRIYGRKHGRRRVLAPLPLASLDEAGPLVRALTRTRLRHGYVIVELNRHPIGKATRREPGGVRVPLQSDARPLIVDACSSLGLSMPGLNQYCTCRGLPSVSRSDYAGAPAGNPCRAWSQPARPKLTKYHGAQPGFAHLNACATYTAIAYENSPEHLERIERVEWA